ncbi:hypothetical protein GCM10010191_09160 [Actinomadura vinacea]|uniref:Uncharacterized protein n=1 Tax=Actinomadura vinacea TaxID=115336 RepID=A0ABN3IGA6_9ACTN
MRRARSQNADRLRITGRVLMHAAEHHHRPIGCSVPGDAATSAGVMAVNGAAYRRAFEQFARSAGAGGPVDLYRELVPWLLGHDHPVHVWDIACPAPDLGTPERLQWLGLPSGDS